MADSFSSSPSRPDVGDVKLARAIARDLLDIGAIALRPSEPFRWSSGLVAPIYCDNRQTIAYPRVRRVIRDGFADVVTNHTLGSSTIAGTATAGIPHAAWLADQLDVPMAYVRSSAKEHGQGERIEGRVEPGEDVIVVEDLVSTGGSALEAVEALRDAGATVQAVLSIFTYELDVATEAFREAQVPLHVLSDFGTLIEVARDREALSEGDYEVLQTWRDDPVAWSEARGGKTVST